MVELVLLERMESAKQLFPNVPNVHLYGHVMSSDNCIVYMLISKTVSKNNKTERTKSLPQ